MRYACSGKPWHYGEDVKCVKNVRIRSFSGPYFLAFGLNTERYSISLCIQSKCGNTDQKKNSKFGLALRR